MYIAFKNKLNTCCVDGFTTRVRVYPHLGARSDTATHRLVLEAYARATPPRPESAERVLQAAYSAGLGGGQVT